MKTDEDLSVSILDLLGVQSFRSIQPQFAELRRLCMATGVLLVGASLVGKSTLVSAVRQDVVGSGVLSGMYTVPMRFITRTPREGDNPAENTPLSDSEFDQMVKTGGIERYWSRPIDGGKEEKYGFPPVPTGLIPVYSAGNGVLYRPERVFPANWQKTSLVVAAYAPERIRLERMQSRSSDLIANRPEEAGYRLADRADIACAYAHIVVRNHGEFEAIAGGEMIRCLAALGSLLQSKKSTQNHSSTSPGA